MLVEKDVALKQAGFKLQKNIEAYLSTKEIVTFRFVWRKRSNNWSETYTLSLKAPASKVMK